MTPKQTKDKVMSDSDECSEDNELGTRGKGSWEALLSESKPSEEVTFALQANLPRGGSGKCKGPGSRMSLVLCSNGQETSVAGSAAVGVSGTKP